MLGATKAIVLRKAGCRAAEDTVPLLLNRRIAHVLGSSHICRVDHIRLRQGVHALSSQLAGFKIEVGLG